MASAVMGPLPRRWQSKVKNAGRMEERSTMPQRKGKILESMQLRRMRVEITRMRTLAVVAMCQSPSLGVAFATAFDAITMECDALLRGMMGWWSPQCFLASTPRTMDSFTDDELRSSFPLRSRGDFRATRVARSPKRTVVAVEEAIWRRGGVPPPPSSVGWARAQHGARADSR
eukprot:scaffold2656_cov365-Pavlova_lutheri.AAC.5